MRLERIAKDRIRIDDKTIVENPTVTAKSIYIDVASGNITMGCLFEGEKYSLHRNIETTISLSTIKTILEDALYGIVEEKKEAICVQPTGAHDAYKLGAIVWHDGKRWKSLHPANVWLPEEGSLWTEI